MSEDFVPYRDAEEAFFAFVNAQQARTEGAQFRAGQGLYNRPGGALDIHGH